MKTHIFSHKYPYSICFTATRKDYMKTVLLLLKLLLSILSLHFRNIRFQTFLDLHTKTINLSFLGSGCKNFPSRRPLIRVRRPIVVVVRPNPSVFKSANLAEFFKTENRWKLNLSTFRETIWKYGFVIFGPASGVKIQNEAKKRRKEKREERKRN